jgi:rhodanese-related sulfurtransferase
MGHSEEFLAAVEAVRGFVAEVTLREWLENMATDGSSVLVDVREDHEWERGHITAAQHLGRGVLERDAVQRFPDKSTPIVLYCGGGYRSLLAGKSLRDMGYTRVWSLSGGYKAWVAWKGTSTS